MSKRLIYHETHVPDGVNASYEVLNDAGDKIGHIFCKGDEYEQMFAFLSDNCWPVGQFSSLIDACEAVRMADEWVADEPVVSRYDK